MSRLCGGAQQLASARFVLDVHLGTLTRQLGLAGVDAAYANDAADDALVGQANAERRVLLTQDRGLLHRRQSVAGRLRAGDTPGWPVHGRAGPVRPAASAMDPLPSLQRAAVPGGEGRRCSCAAARHPAHLPGVLPLRGLRPGVLARRAQQAPRADHRLRHPRRQHRHKQISTTSGMSGYCQYHSRHAYSSLSHKRRACLGAGPALEIMVYAAEFPLSAA